MTYIDLINRFWKFQKYDMYNTSTALLYLKLLDICNSNSWKSFMRSNLILAAETGMSVTRLLEARKNLVEAGLIKFKSGKKKREAGAYFIVHEIDDPKLKDVDETIFTREPGMDKTTKSGTQSGTESGTESVTVSVTESVTVSGTESEKKPDDNNRFKDKDKDRGKEKGKKKSPAAAAAPLPLKKVMENYNLICNRFPKVTEFSKSRKAAAGARLKEHGYDKVMKMLQMAAESDFLAGSNERNWVASYDWLMRPTNFVKVLEGHYENRRNTHYNNKPSTLEILEETYNEIITDGDFAD